MVESKRNISQKKRTIKRKYAGAVIYEKNILGQPFKDSQTGEYRQCISGTDDRLGSSLGLRKSLPSCSIFDGGKKSSKRTSKRTSKKKRTLSKKNKKSKK